MMRRARFSKPPIASLARPGSEVDDREGLSPGAKFFHWERRGVPVVLELGPRDLASGSLVLKRRDTGVKESVSQDGIAARLAAVYERMQPELYESAQARLAANSVEAESIGEVEEILSGVGREGRRQIRVGALEGRSGVRPADEGLQSDRALLPAR